MYYSYVEIEYVATSFSLTRTDLALKLLSLFACAIRAAQSAPIDLQVNFTTMQEAAMMNLITLEMTPRG
jgi:hypothetical protein